MKKLISLAMAVAMTLSLIPATAFAGISTGTIEGTAKIVDAAEIPVGADKNKEITGPELQIKVTDVHYTQLGSGVYNIDLTAEIDGAEFPGGYAEMGSVIRNGVVISEDNDLVDELVLSGIHVEKGETTEGRIIIDGQLAKGDIIAIPLAAYMDKTSSNSKATISVSGNIEPEIDDLVFASVVKKGITASIKKIVDVAEEEIVDLYKKGIKVEFETGTFGEEDKMTLKLSKGFEFANSESEVKVEGNNGGVEDIWVSVDDNMISLTFESRSSSDIPTEIAITGLEVEATTADTGDIATITVKYNGASDAVEVVKVVDYKVILSVDEDEDVPVIYSGVNVDNCGITDDSDHVSLEVTVEETFSGAWSMRQGFNFTLPEGVYVADVSIEDAEGFEREGKDVTDLDDAWIKAFKDAYRKGDHKGFEFKKRVFDDVDTKLNEDKAKLTFTLTLVADPTFEGDVELGFEGALVDTQEVTIATFVKPYTVSAEQNDMIIDYRFTKIPTPIVITETADGLWAEDGAAFGFQIDKGDLLEFEDDATFEVDEASGMEIDDYTFNEDEYQEAALIFMVEAESDEAATVTISDIELFMQRNIPAGPYDLSIVSTLALCYESQLLFAPDDEEEEQKPEPSRRLASDRNSYNGDNYVFDVCDYSDTVKEAFVNVITAGRDQDDASFTTKVVVPVGEMYLISGENQVALDVPAYITAAGYTMLPVRAVAKALGINNNNVLWNSEARTATILYGQRIITMTVGAKVVNVNGSALPASAAVEITNNRTFLPMRDLATALGVTDITWDPATKTATLNGSGNK